MIVRAYGVGRCKNQKGEISWVCVSVVNVLIRSQQRECRIKCNNNYIIITIEAGGKINKGKNFKKTEKKLLHYNIHLIRIVIV